MGSNNNNNWDERKIFERYSQENEKTPQKPNYTGKISSKVETPVLSFF